MASFTLPVCMLQDLSQAVRVTKNYWALWHRAPQELQMLCLPLQGPVPGSHAGAQRGGAPRK